MTEIYLNEKPIFKNTKIAKSHIDKLLGIMFKKNIKEDAILFTDTFWLHSFFCKINFNAIYLDKNYKIIKIEENIKPNRILKPVFGAKYVIEYFKDIKIDKNTKLDIKNIL